MSSFPVVVTPAVAAIAIQLAGREQRTVMLVIGDESDPAGITSLHFTHIREDFEVSRSAIRATDLSHEALVKEWIEGSEWGLGGIAVVWRSNGEIVLTHGAWEIDS